MVFGSSLYIEAVSQATKDDFPQVTIADLLALPVPTQIPEQARARLVKLVAQVLEAKQSDPDAEASKLEREIDQQVYALYGLTPEEIKIVESASVRTSARPGSAAK